MPPEIIISQPNSEGGFKEIHESVRPENAEERLKDAKQADFELAQKLLGKKLPPNAKSETPEAGNIITLPKKRDNLEKEPRETEAA